MAEPPLQRLEFWRDPVARSGPENMAVDEWLLRGADSPVLRVYGWGGAWVSLGYFGAFGEARRLFAGQDVAFVRRATGGGVVDHRVDRTYTLVVPRGCPLAGLRGADSYRVVHAALQEAMRMESVEARLLTADGPGGTAACFDHPVAWDLADAGGRKIAGAGQRRARHGLLHQGSVQGVGEEVFREMAAHLAGQVEHVALDPDEGTVARLVAAKFGTTRWLERRR